MRFDGNDVGYENDYFECLGVAGRHVDVNNGFSNGGDQLQRNAYTPYSFLNLAGVKNLKKDPFLDAESHIKNSNTFLPNNESPGIEFLFSNRVSKVKKNSWAERNDIQVGDELMEINGKLLCCSSNKNGFGMSSGFSSTFYFNNITTRNGSFGLRSTVFRLPELLREELKQRPLIVLFKRRKRISTGNASTIAAQAHNDTVASLTNTTKMTKHQFQQSSSSNRSSSTNVNDATFSNTVCNHNTKANDEVVVKQQLQQQLQQQHVDKDDQRRDYSIISWFGFY